MLKPQYILPFDDEIIVDNFAGGGGASTGIEMATGRHVDIAINHDPKALAMHTANHPQTLHLCESVWDVNPREVMPDRKVGLLWLSPDCKHFSKAKGGKPREKKIRGLAWVGVRWAAIRKPRIIILENVEEFVTWGPLDAEGKPCQKNKGREFNCFVNALKRLGYVVDHKELRACDYGAPTIRKRFFLIARCDGLPIVWPEPTHFDPAIEAKRKRARGEKMRPIWRTAAECIDFTQPGHSIFLSKEEGRKVGAIRPLADATMRRIAKGMMKYVINNPKPYIVTMAHGEASGNTKRWGQGIREIDKPFPTITASGGYGIATPFITEHANGSSQRNMSADAPLRTQCAQVKGGHFAVVTPTLVQTGYGERQGQEPRALDIEAPLGTVVSTGKHALVSAFLAQYNNHGDGSPNAGHELTDPLSTCVASRTVQGLATAHIQRDFGNSVGHEADKPMGTLTQSGGGKAALVQSFLIKYYGSDQDPRLEEPLHTITSKDRFGLVVVKNEFYQVNDIYLRMLNPPELFKCQGFPDDYIIDRGIVIDQDGNFLWIQLTKTEQVRMCGNSVPPQFAYALVKANYMTAHKLGVAA